MVITGVGLVSALGDDAVAVGALIRAGVSGLRPLDVLASLPDPSAAVAAGPDLKPWLKRRKDAKLLPRSAELALAAAGDALRGWTGDRVELGLFLGVGREPPDSGESEACLIASCRDGLLDDALLAGPGRDLYPPLLPLKTLPNMALAHVSINLGLMGENAAWAGEEGAGWTALHAAWWAVAEGRCAAALAGGADSLVDLGSARDRLRMGRPGAPGEAAALLLLERADHAAARGARALALACATSGSEAAAASADRSALRGALGCTGAAEGPLALALALFSLRGLRTDPPISGDGWVSLAGADPGLPALGLRLSSSPDSVTA